MIDDRSGPKPNQHVLLKENPSGHIRADADRALALARQARAAGADDEEAAFARIATLLYFVMLEGLINFVYEWSGVSHSQWRDWSVSRKWLRAAAECRPGIGLMTPLDPSEALEHTEVYKRFVELKELRNSMVHSQATFTWIPENRVSKHLERQDDYSLTGLPKVLRRFRCEHAETAQGVAAQMIGWLDRCLDGSSAHLYGATSVMEYVVEDEDPED